MIQVRFEIQSSSVFVSRSFLYGLFSATIIIVSAAFECGESTFHRAKAPGSLVIGTTVSGLLSMSEKTG
jgi:hypothetical protein